MRVAFRNTTLLLYTALALGPHFGPVTASASQVCDYAVLIARRAEAARFKQTHLHSSYAVPADNEAFFRRMIGQAEDEMAIYFHVENAVLKQLNDKVFGDKELSASTLNLYKRIFFENLQRNPFLFSRIPRPEDGGVYSDYKSIRLVAIPKQATELDQIETHFASLHNRVTQEFVAELNRFEKMKGFYQNHQGLLADPAHWNLAGMGTTASEASVQTRRSRKPLPGEERPQGISILARRFDGRTAILVAEDLHRIERMRHNLEAQFTKSPTLIKNGILDLDAVDLLRKAQGDTSIHGQTEYRAYLTRRFSERFAVRLTEAQCDLLQQYYSHVNELAPSLYIKDQEPIALAELERATHGVVSFDFAGQNNLNLLGTMESFHQAALLAGNKKGLYQYATLALALANERQQRESDAFDSTKDVLSNALRASGLTGSGQNLQPRPKYDFTASGDDATFLPNSTLGILQQMRLVRELRNRWTPASRFRVTFQPQNFTDSNSKINDEQRFTLISQAESVEKRLRDELEADGVPHPTVKDTLFAIRTHPTHSGQVPFDVLFAQGRNGDKQELSVWRDRIRKALTKEWVLAPNYSLHRVFNADSALHLVK